MNEDIIEDNESIEDDGLKSVIAPSGIKITWNPYNLPDHPGVFRWFQRYGSDKGLQLFLIVLILQSTLLIALKLPR